MDIEDKLRKDLVELHDKIVKNISPSATVLQSMLSSGKKPSQVVSDLVGKENQTTMFTKLLLEHSKDKNTLQYSLEAFILSHPEYADLFSDDAQKNAKKRLKGYEDVYS